jgi:hypothetical protein
MAVVIKPGPDIEDPMSVAPTWAEDDFPPMGSPDEVRDQLDAWITAARLETEGRDEASGVLLPDSVSAISFQVHRELVRAVWITRPTGELLELLWRNGQAGGWRVFDVSSESEYVESDFT